MAQTKIHRKKKKTKVDPDGIAFIKSTFNFIKEPDRVCEGFIAHELQEYVPQAASGIKDAVWEDGTINAQSVEYGRLTPVLVGALQEAITRIEALENA